LYPGMMMEGLEIRDIQKSYEGKPVLVGISFSLLKGEILALLGPSGSGKTTLLEIIAGLEEPDGGDLLWDGQPLQGIPAHQREFGLMFQDYVLFPHKNVGANVAFGLRMAGDDPREIQSRVRDVLALVGLPDFEQRDVEPLSGGEQQRVALARTLAPQPRLVMLDEPLGALDRSIRERLISELREILKRSCQTVLYVTHDQDEAFTIADRVVILGEGRVFQIGTPREIYNQPNSPYVARFLGMDNMLEGTANPNQGGSLISTTLGNWQIRFPAQGAGTVLLRPDQIQLADQGLEKPASLTGRLISSTFSGASLQIRVQIKDHQFRFQLADTAAGLPAPGEELTIWFSPFKALQFFPHSNQVH
jgi:ABC-type Fe3+/spermidine/putrescine transport system ATPase subunit